MVSLSGRLWFSALSDYKITIANEKLNLDEFRVAFTIKKELYIAVSKQTDDVLVKKWQKVFDSMVKDGTLAKFYFKYSTEN